MGTTGKEEDRKGIKGKEKKIIKEEEEEEKEKDIYKRFLPDLKNPS